MDCYNKMNGVGHNTDIKEKIPQLQDTQPTHFLPSSSVLSWNSPTHHQYHMKVNSGINFSMNNVGVNQAFPINKGQIITQLDPQEFSTEDVLFLQKLNRELHVQNMQKTLKCIQLEQAQNQLKDEITVLKREDAKRREESNGLLKIALDEISSHQKVLQQPSSPKQLDSFDRDEIIKLREKCIAMECELVKQRRQIEIYEEKYEYFNEIVNNSAMFLAENKKNLKISVNKVTSLEAELAIWKQRCYEYETFGERSCISQLQATSRQSATLLHQQAKPMDPSNDCNFQISITNESDTIGSPPPRTHKLDRHFLNNAVHNYLIPRVPPSKQDVGKKMT